MKFSSFFAVDYRVVIDSLKLSACSNGSKGGIIRMGAAGGVNVHDVSQTG